MQLLVSVTVMYSNFDFTIDKAYFTHPSLVSIAIEIQAVCYNIRFKTVIWEGNIIHSSYERELVIPSVVYAIMNAPDMRDTSTL